MKNSMIVLAYIAIGIVIFSSIPLITRKHKVIIQGSSIIKRVVQGVYCIGLVMVILLQFMEFTFATRIGDMFYEFLPVLGAVGLLCLCYREGISETAVITMQRHAIDWDKLEEVSIEETEQYVYFTFYTKYLNKKYHTVTLRFKHNYKEQVLKMIENNL